MVLGSSPTVMFLPKVVMNQIKVDECFIVGLLTVRFHYNPEKEMSLCLDRMWRLAYPKSNQLEVELQVGMNYRWVLALPRLK